MKLDVDLVKYSQLRSWSPSVGDVIHKDGLLFRWCGVITGIKGDKVYIRKSGNVHLLMMGEYTEEILVYRKVINSAIGSYFVVSDGTYYV